MRRLAPLVAALLVLLVGAGFSVGWADLDEVRTVAAPRQAPAPVDPAPTDTAPAPPATEPAPAAPAPAAPAPAPAARPVVPRSVAVGHPWHGALRNGVQLPASGATFFTWDWGRRVSPNAPWRRYGTDVLVEWLQAVLAGYHAEHPEAPRIGVADLSRTTGGYFGQEVAGGLGHASHQNGLDVDVLYPRRDRVERPALHPSQVDHDLAQALVDAFRQAGAEKLFVGPRVGLKGPKGVVVPLTHHDDHVHVRIAKRAVSLWRTPLGLR